MKNTNKVVASFAGLALGAGVANAAVTVYEDNFDNDTLVTNTGIGGGMTTKGLRDAVRNTFDDNGNLASGPDSNAASRGVVSTNNAFDVSGGFILTVTLVGSSSNTGYFDVALTQANLTSSMSIGDEGIFTTFGGAADGNNGNSYYGAGIQYGTFYGTGISFNDGTGTVGGAAIQTVDVSAGFGNDATIALTVNPDDSWSYTVNGTLAASGADFVAGAGVIDLSAPMYVNAFSQPQSSISSIKLEAIPEPSSAALLGLGGLTLILRRRR